MWVSEEGVATLNSMVREGVTKKWGALTFEQKLAEGEIPALQIKWRDRKYKGPKQDLCVFWGTARWTVRLKLTLMGRAVGHEVRGDQSRRACRRFWLLLLWDGKPLEATLKAWAEKWHDLTYFLKDHSGYYVENGIRAGRGKNKSREINFCHCKLQVSRMTIMWWW